MNRALTIALEVIGAQSFDDVWLEVDSDPRLKAIGAVTWKLLENDYAVRNESTGGARAYRLTARGWLNALEVTGMWASDAFRDRCSRLVACLKASVKGRDDEALLEWKDVARDAGLPEDWVWSALQAAILEEMWPDRNYVVRWEPPLVFVPISFGLQS